MRTIYNIAKAELQNLFYSPIAWFIIIIFTFQTGMVVGDIFAGYARSVELGYGLYGLTADFCKGRGAMFFIVQQYLYLYMPLLTMGLMSREFSSGSIKLYYSSPVTNSQIIMGKYLSMMIYSLLLIGVLAIYAIMGSFLIDNYDWPLVLSGLLGLYLLVCTYAAIGLFMSCLTSYQVVAAVGTLTVLGILNYIGYVWQDIAFVRDLTYWLSISGRSTEFIRGLICSEDFLYFIFVPALFLLLAIVRLSANRQKSPWFHTLGRYVGVVAVIMLLGYVTSRPAARFFYDTTRGKDCTLTPGSQEIIKKVKGGLTITTYTNLLDKNCMIAMPDRINQDLDRFKQYLRFKPEIKMKYVYYYDSVNNPNLERRYLDMTDRERAEKLAKTLGLDFDLFLSPEEIKKQIDLRDEGNHFVRVLERDNGDRSFLRVFDDAERLPSEAEISVAFRLLVERLPRIGFLHGHGERDNNKMGERDYGFFAQYKPFRYSLVNQGLDFTDVTLDQKIPEDIFFVIIADMRKPLSPLESENLDEYIQRGGNLLILGDVKRQDNMNSVTKRLGVEFMSGIVVNEMEGSSPDNLLGFVSSAATELAEQFYRVNGWKRSVLLPGCTSLSYTTDKGFDVIPLLVSDSLKSWNELETTDFINDTLTMNPAIGEVNKPNVVAVALSREVGEKTQKIIVVGDSDWLSNSVVVNEYMNYTFLMGICSWITDNVVPIDVSRPEPIDNTLFLSQKGAKVLKGVLLVGFPVLLLLVAVILSIRRRGR